jgi:transposase
MNGNALKFLIFLSVTFGMTVTTRPPYSPELNPVERIWHYLRSHWLANSVFRSLADHGLIRSLCAVAWAPALPAL